MKIRQKLRPIIAALIISAWVGIELIHGIEHPTLELRLILISSLIYMFGESAMDAVEIVRGGTQKQNK